MASMYDIGEKGSSLVFALVVLAVLSIGVVSLLQSAAMSFGTGSFQQERQQALAAAESGIAIASAMLVGSDAPQIPRSEYPSLEPSIDSTSSNWAGPGTGPLPEKLALGRDTSYRVWVSPNRSGTITITSEGKCGRRTRVVQQLFSYYRTGLPFLMSTTSESLNMTLEGSAEFVGDFHIEGLNSDSIDIDIDKPVVGTLYVRPDADIVGIRDKAGKHFSSVEADGNTYRHPPSISPKGLPYYYEHKLVIGDGESREVTISKSGKYSSVRVASEGKCHMEIDTTESDIIIYTTGDFAVHGFMNLQIVGDNALHLYVDGDFIWNGERIGKSLEDPLDPTKFVVHCTDVGWSSVSPKNVWINGVPETNMVGVIYAPKSQVHITGDVNFCGAIVGHRIIVDEKTCGTLCYPKGDYATKLRQMNLGLIDMAIDLVPGSWRELPVGKG